MFDVLAEILGLDSFESEREYTLSNEELELIRVEILRIGGTYHANWQSQLAELIQDIGRHSEVFENSTRRIAERVYLSVPDFTRLYLDTIRNNTVQALSDSKIIFSIYGMQIRLDCSISPGEYKFAGYFP